MKYLSKTNIIAFVTLLLILTPFALCNSSVAHYKTRIEVDTVNLEIAPYQPVNIVVEETTTDDTTENQQENLEENTFVD